MDMAHKMRARIQRFSATDLQIMREAASIGFKRRDISNYFKVSEAHLCNIINKRNISI